jgi:hypothetical protein
MSIKKQLRKIGSFVTVVYNPSEKNFTVSNAMTTLTNPSLKKALKKLKSQVKSKTKQSKEISAKKDKNLLKM